MKEAKLDENRTVLLVHVEGKGIFAMGAKCTHFGAPLVKGVLAGSRVVCPWHAACFNACSGDIEDGPALDAAPSFKVQVTPDGDIFVEVPDRVPRGVPPAVATGPTDPRHMLIVGAGPAGAAAAETLRSNGFTGRITMLGLESAPPYDRTKLSKNMAAELDGIVLRKPDFYAAHGITLRAGAQVTALRPERHEAVLATGDVITYDAVLCATGGPARTFRAPETFTIPGADARNIFPLRDLTHAEGIERALASKGAVQRAADGSERLMTPAGADVSVVIIGSSFIGMEAAGYLVQTKKVRRVTVVGMESEPFERVLGKEVGAFMRRVHEAQGVTFRLGSVAAAFHAGPGGEVSEVELKGSGERLPADVVIIGSGIIPATKYLEGAEGVELHTRAPGGVRTDECLRIAPDAYAAGDIAYFPYRYAADASCDFVRIEHYDVAMDQGRVAAQNMLGMSVRYEGVPFFWTSQFGKTVRYAGYASRPDDIIVHGSLAAPLAEAAFTVFYVLGERVAAAATFNRDPQAAAAMELIRLGEMPSPRQLRGVDSFDLQEYLKQRVAAGVGAKQTGGGASSAPRSASA